MMEVNNRKSKYEECVEKKMFIFMNAGITQCAGGKRPDGSMCAGVFEIDIVIRTKVGQKPIIEPTQSVKEPIGTFFKQSFSGHVITSVGACVVGSDLYMIPDDTGQDSDETDTILPWKFNLIDKDKTEIPTFSLAKSIKPLVVSIHDQVYALSFANFKSGFFSKSRFKSVYPYMPYMWTALISSPFDKNSYGLSGYAVLNEGFVLVSLTAIGRCDNYLMYSYNPQTGEWKPVAEADSYCPLLYGESVVIKNDIYTHMHFRPGVLIVLSYTCVNSPEHDISVGSARRVKGFKLDKDYAENLFERIDGRIDSCTTSGILAKLDDEILCTLSTLFLDRDRVLHVLVSMFLLEERECCTTLDPFRCLLKVGNELSSPILKSCVFLNPAGTSDHPPSKRAALQDDKQMDLS